MNIVPMNNTNIQTMSSREIAELTGKEHRNVLRDATKMLIELHGQFEALKFEHYYIGANGKKNPELLLPKRETLILVSGYSTQLRARIIDRWQELEAQATRQVPTNYAEALRVAADEYERRLAAEKRAKELEGPAVRAWPSVEWSSQSSRRVRP